MVQSALIVAVVSASALAGRWVLGRLEGYVLSLPRYRSAPAQVEINMPEFMDPGLFRRAVFDQNDLPDKFSTADPGAIEKLYAAYRANPWVKSVESVGDGKNEFPADMKVRQSADETGSRLKVELNYRRPTALVRASAHLYLIDEQGVVLADRWEDGEFDPTQGGLDKGPKGVPGRWVPLRMTPDEAKCVTLGAVGQPEPAFPIIDGVAEPPPAPGRVWASAGLKAALEMIRPGIDDPTRAGVRNLIRSEIRTLEVYREGSQKFPTWSIRMITPKGTIIDWGRPPGAEGLIDPPADKKLERLAVLRREFQGFDGRFKSATLRCGRREAGIRGVEWMFAAVEKLPSHAPPTNPATPAAAATRSTGPATKTSQPPAGRPSSRRG